jgi:hypothetical protein
MSAVCFESWLIASVASLTGRAADAVVAAVAVGVAAVLAAGA